ncbi:MAG: ATP-binding protein [Variibacter sp.]
MLPIRWRIFAIAGLNTAVVLLLAALIWDGARSLSSAWGTLQQPHESGQALDSPESEMVRLQGLLLRSASQPQPQLRDEIARQRAALLDGLNKQADADPALADAVKTLATATDRLVNGFDALRAAREAVARTYEQEILTPAKAMPGLYAAVENGLPAQDTAIAAPLRKSREALSAFLLAANAYSFAPSPARFDVAAANADAIGHSLSALSNLAGNDRQRAEIDAIRQSGAALRTGLAHMADEFTRQAALLKQAVENDQATAAAIDALSRRLRAREQQAKDRFGKALNEVYLQVLLVAGLFLLLVIFIGIAVAGSISTPLRDLRATMLRIVGGDYTAPVHGLKARDEIGEMARAVEVFRENAVAKQRAEIELRASKEHAESALSDLRETQRSLIEAEKLAALGSLVAGVAHEVNNPVGIGLTVASSLARRCEAFAAEIGEGQLRRARLTEFVDGARDASNQLVLNLERAEELIRSFKQVAVDRSHETRRPFDLRESTEQIVSSLRAGLKKAHLTLNIDVPDGIVMEGYPGAYGQVLTNLVLNATTHAFAGGLEGVIRIEARRLTGPQVEINFSDDGAGMTEEVRRHAFDPFFTTRRNHGGTGLGLHIVYNLVTRRLGGRISFVSAPNRGTTFRIVLPLNAPLESPSAATDADIATDR